MTVSGGIACGRVVEIVMQLSRVRFGGWPCSRLVFIRSMFLFSALLLALVFPELLLRFSDSFLNFLAFMKSASSVDVIASLFLFLSPARLAAEQARYFSLSI